MISASVAKGLSQQQMRFVIAVEVNCGISQADARAELEAEGWNYMEAMVSIRCEQNTPAGYVSNYPGQPAGYGVAFRVASASCERCARVECAGFNG